MTTKEQRLQDWQARIADYHASGLTMAAWCQEHSVTKETLKYWLRKWEHNGFWLFYRRLERGTFQWLADHAGHKFISSRELRWLLYGLSLSQRQVIPQVIAETVI